jgi:hypothetical protein
MGMHNHLAWARERRDDIGFVNLELFIQYALSGVSARGMDDTYCAKWEEFS